MDRTRKMPMKKKIFLYRKRREKTTKILQILPKDQKILKKKAHLNQFKTTIGKILLTSLKKQIKRKFAVNNSKN
jgi:hypothetical protein